MSKLNQILLLTALTIAAAVGSAASDAGAKRGDSRDLRRVSAISGNSALSRACGKAAVLSNGKTPSRRSSFTRSHLSAAGCHALAGNLKGTALHLTAAVKTAHIVSDTACPPYPCFSQASDILAWSPSNVRPFDVATVDLTGRTGTEQPSMLANTDIDGYSAYLVDGNSQGASSTVTVFGGSQNAGNVMNFPYWQYIDEFYYYAHYVLAVPPTVWTNAAHRNGVKILGVLTGDCTGCAGQLDTFLEDTNAGPQLVAIAQAYGFDGWMFDLEPDSRTTPDYDAADPVMEHVTQHGLEAVYYSWGEGGGAGHAGAVNSSNNHGLLAAGQWVSDYSFQNTGRPADSYSFLNTNDEMHLRWDTHWASDIYTFQTTCTASSTTTLYNGAGCLSTSGLFTDQDFDVMSQTPSTTYYQSLALYAVNWPYYGGRNNGSTPASRDTYLRAEHDLWVGYGAQYTADFTNSRECNPGSASGAAASTWSVANKITPRGLALEAPFVTRFNTGEGDSISIQGETPALSSTQTSWNLLSAEDPSPTWLCTNAGAQIVPAITYDDSYDGGSALSISGSFAGSSLPLTALFDLETDLPDNPALTITYKNTSATSTPQIAAAVDSGKLGIIPSQTTQTVGDGWTRAVVPLSTSGKQLTTLGVGFTGHGTVDATIGELGIVDQSDLTAPNPICGVPSHGGDSISWTDPSQAETSYYNVYAASDSATTFLGRTFVETYDLSHSMFPMPSGPVDAYVVQPVDTSGLAADIAGFTKKLQRALAHRAVSLRRARDAGALAESGTACGKPLTVWNVNGSTTTGSTTTASSTLTAFVPDPVTGLPVSDPSQAAETSCAPTPFEGGFAFEPDGSYLYQSTTAGVTGCDESITSFASADPGTQQSVTLDLSAGFSIGPPSSSDSEAAPYMFVGSRSGGGGVVSVQLAPCGKPADGSLTPMSQTLPGTGFPAVAADPRGRYVFGYSGDPTGANPGTLYSFAAPTECPAPASMTQVDTVTTLVKYNAGRNQWPALTVDPTGAWLAVGGTSTNTSNPNAADVQVFAIDDDTGNLTPAGTLDLATLGLRTAVTLQDMAFGPTTASRPAPGQLVISAVGTGCGLIPITISRSGLAAGTRVPTGCGGYGDQSVVGDSDLAFSPDGRYLYFTYSQAGQGSRLSTFSVNPAGSSPVFTQINTGADVVVGNSAESAPQDSVTVAPAQAPTAAWALQSTNQLTATLDASTSTSDEIIAAYSWDFGDGSPVETTTNPVVSHTFSGSGSYTVTMTVTDDMGCSTEYIAEGHAVYCNGDQAADYSAAVAVFQGSDVPTTTAAPTTTPTPGPQPKSPVNPAPSSPGVVVNENPLVLSSRSHESPAGSGFWISAECLSADCTLDLRSKMSRPLRLQPVSGHKRGKKKASTVSVESRRIALEAGRRTALIVRFAGGKRALAAITRALKRGEKLEVHVKGRAVSNAGTSTASTTVTLSK